MPNDRPKFTIHYNITSSGSKWIGTGWEFFDDSIRAEIQYNLISKRPGHSATFRHYHEDCDFKHLGAAHRMRIRSSA